MTKAFKIKKHVDTEINKGDLVNIVDGSGLTHVSDREDFYIVCGYPKKTGSSLAIKHLPFEVVEVCVNDIVVDPDIGLEIVYAPDIIIKHNLLEFYICSEFVKKINLELTEK